jgi:hypothetical protein
LAQPKKDDQDDKDWIICRDYSLRKRLPNREKFPHAADVKSKKKKESELSKLQCLEIALEEPLCGLEWQNLSEVINHTKGLAWL